MSVLNNSNAISAGGAYNITDSLRLRSSASAYLDRTPTTAGNRKTWTWSAWIKRGLLSGSQVIFGSSNGTQLADLTINGSNQFEIDILDSNSTRTIRGTTAVLRDPSAWYHIVVVIDTTQSTDTNRIKLYVNNQILSTSAIVGTYPAQNAETIVNSTTGIHNIGRRQSSADRYFDGYMTEVNFVDGQALTPSDFGETNADGVWSPKKYEGTYGTNGFYLPMKETTQATGFNTITYTAINDTQSFTNVGFSPDLVWIKSRDNSTGHQLFDTVRGALKRISSNNTAAEDTPAGSLTSFDNDGFTIGNAASVNGTGTSPFVAWCWDANSDNTTGSELVTNGTFDSGLTGWTAVNCSASVSNGKLSATFTSSGAYVWQAVSGLTIGQKYVLSGQCSGANDFFRVYTGSAIGTAETILGGNASSNAGLNQVFFQASATTVYIRIDVPNSQTIVWDDVSIKQVSYDGTIPSYTKTNTSTGFSVVTYTGNGSSSASIGHGLGTTPAMIIAKSRSSTQNWRVYHSSFGTTTSNTLYLNLTNAVSTTDSERISAVASDTFTVTQTTGGALNASGQNYVAYCFSEVSGYSKFGSYTGTGASGNSVTGLGFEPAFVMIKRTDSTGDWQVYDNTRDIDDPRLLTLYANGSFAEDQNATNRSVDFDSDGFTIDSTGVYLNASGGTFIYMAFADTRDYQWNFDASGNKNNWTPNNINSNASSETTYDLMSDVPSLADEDTGNFATLNPLYAGINGLSASNLTFTPSGWMHIPSTISLPTDSSTGIYWEETLTTAVAANYHASGVTNGKHTASTAFDSNNAVISMSGGAWRLYKSGDANNAVAITGAGGSASNGDVHMFAYKNGYLYWGINGSWYPTGANPATDTSPLNASQITAQQYALCGGYTGITKSINFGQRPFAYTPPTGYKKLNTYNLPDSSITDGSQYFNTVTYTGDGSTSGNSITGVGFEPDFVWIKSRNIVEYHMLMDSVRGDSNVSGKYDTMSSALTNSEATWNATWFSNYGALTSLDSDGFTVVDGSSTTSDPFNGSGDSYVAWNWRASDSTAVSNTDGTITSTVSANTTSGFSVITFTGNGTAGATIGHGLGAVPKFIVVKNRTYGVNWRVYHASLGATKFLSLNLGNTVGTSSLEWNNTTPTSSVITVGTSDNINRNGDDIVMYAFADVEGFSKIGSYVGNGVNGNGPFVYCGFRPAFILFKNTNTTQNWIIHDVARDTYNYARYWLSPNTSGAEYTDANIQVDLVSNGFKIRTSIGTELNGNGNTIIYMAFAENPFKNSLAR